MKKLILIAGLAIVASQLHAQNANPSQIRTVGDYLNAEANWLDWRNMPSLDWRKSQSLGKVESFGWQKPQYIGKLSNTQHWTYGAPPSNGEPGHQLLSTLAHFFTGSLGQDI